MRKKLILCSSITYAIKGRDVLSKKGYSVYIRRPPVNEPDCGCGHCLSVDEKDLEIVINILKENHVKIKRIIEAEREEGNDLS